MKQNIALSHEHRIPENPMLQGKERDVSNDPKVKSVRFKKTGYMNNIKKKKPTAIPDNT